MAKQKNKKFAVNLFNISKEPFQKGLKNLIKNLFSFLLNELQIKKKINIIIVDSNFIQQINKTYRNKNLPTDVLSFVYNDRDLLGEIFLCLESNKEKALKGKTDELTRLKKIMIHGFLHLVGYDHRTDRENFIMEEKTLELLNIFNK